MKKKKKVLRKNVALVLTSVLFFAGIVMVAALSQRQEVRSHAAGSVVQAISAAIGSTGQTKATSVTIAKPTLIQPGDVLVAILQADYGHIGGTLPAGWKLINEKNENDDLTIQAYYKVVTAAEPANYTWQIIINAENKGLAGGTIMAFRGVNPTNPVFANAINLRTKDPTKIACPSVNAPVGSILLCGYTHDDPEPNIQVPSSMTRVSYFTIRNNDAHAVAYEKITKAGPTGQRIANIPRNFPGVGNGSNDLSMAIALQPGDGIQVQPSMYCLGCGPTAALSATPSATASPSATVTASASGTTNTSDKGFLAEFLAFFLALFASLFGMH